MARCSSCHATFPDRSHLRMLRAAGGSWALVCQECANSPRRTVDEGAAEEDREAEGPDSRAAAHTERLRSGRLAEEEIAFFERVEDLLAELVAWEPPLIETADEDKPKRIHQRHAVDLQMDFAFLRDSRQHAARVLDVSQGGVRFLSPLALQVGQVLKAVVYPAQGDEQENRIRNLLEIRRVARNQEGLMEIGARFVKRASVGDDTDRREHARREVEVPVFYQPEGCDVIWRGQTMDLSQNGVYFEAVEELAKDDVLRIMLRTRAPDFVDADLRAEARVVRIAAGRHWPYGYGCAFGKLQAIPLSEAGD